MIVIGVFFALCMFFGFIIAIIALIRANLMQEQIHKIYSGLQELSFRIHEISDRMDKIEARSRDSVAAQPVAKPSMERPPAPTAGGVAHVAPTVQPVRPVTDDRVKDIASLISDMTKPAPAPAPIPMAIPQPAPVPAVEIPPAAPAAPQIAVPPPPPPPRQPEPEPEPEPEPIQEPWPTAQPDSATAPEPVMSPAAPASAEQTNEWWSSFEERVGQRWMTWLGVLAVVLGALFFLQYAIKHGWISYELRVTVGLACGAAILFLGDRFARRKMRALGQGLMGGGLAILYATLYTGFGIYHILPSGIAFGGMAVVSAVGLALSVLHDALPVSFIAVLGGFLTPVVVSAGTNQRDALCAYLLLLDLSVLSIAFFRQWRALLSLAFVGTAALFFAWFRAYYEPAAMAPTLSWVGAFYASFLLMPFAHHLRRRTPLGVEQFAAAMASAVCAFLMAYRILWPAHEHVLGFIAMGMSACYAALGVFSRRRVPQDERSLFGFTLLSVTLLTLSAALHLKLNGITIAWSVESVALLLMGYRFRYYPLRIGGAIVLLVALSRVIARHWPMHPYVAGESFTLFLNQHFGVVIFVALAGGAFALVGKLWEREANPVDRSATTLFALASGLLATFAVQFEVREWIRCQPIARPESLRCWQFCFDTLIISLGAAGFFAAGTALRSKAGRLTTIPLLILAGFMAGFAYAQQMPAWPPFANLRFVAAGLALGVLFCFGLVGRRDREHSSLIPIVAGYLATLLLDTELTHWAAAQPTGYWTQPAYSLICMHLAACLAGAAGFVIVAGLAKSLRTLYAGLAPAAMAYCVSIWLYCIQPWESPLFFNAGFILSLALLASVFTSAGMFGRHRKGSGQALGIVAGYALTALVHFELGRWIGFAQPNDSIQRYDIVALDVFIGTLGAAIYLAAGYLLENRAVRMAGLAPLGIAAVLALRAYALDMPGQWILGFNARFAVSLLCALAGLAYAFLHWRRGERGTGQALYLVSIPFLLLILSLEDFLYWQHGAGLDFERARWAALLSLSLIWALFAIGLTAIGFWRNVQALRLAGLLPLGVAAIIALRTYALGMPGEWILGCNARFAVSLLCALAGLAYAFLHWRRGERGAGQALYVLAIPFLLLILSLEDVLYWRDGAGLDFERARWAALLSLSMIWALFAIGLTAIGFWRKVQALRLAGLLPLGVAAIIALRTYALDMPGQWILGLNLRFAVSLLCALAGLAYAFLHLRRGERRAGQALYVLTIPFLLLILSLEDFLYWRYGAGLDFERARWMSQMSLSIVWALYAIALVAVGFWRRTRALRLAGLALFGITAAKLVFVDIAHIQQVYRIVSFIACGLLMIGVSYLYHRIEKLVRPNESQEQRTAGTEE